MTWLGDKIYSIREAAVVNLVELTKKFGTQWSQVNIIPKVVALYQHSNYLYRLTSLASIHALASPMNRETFEGSMLPVLLQSAQDPVPNIRIRAARIMGMLFAKFDTAPLVASVTGVLESMKEDSDIDVKYFAEEAIAALKGAGA